MQGFGEPDRVENAMCDDDSDQEPVDIIGDSDDDTCANPPQQHGPSSSASQQYPPHFSTLNLDVLGQQEDGGNTNKDEAVLSVKDYSIRRGVEYIVIESDHLKYHGKCKQFGKGCTWLIRIALHARKGTWEVRRYNGPHTCLATSISSDHRQLDYHVICARNLPLVRADAAVKVKVLQQATEADYGFRPSYRNVWMAKQKAVAQIYEDWKESYAELPRWMLGVQPTMAGTITVLKTSPVRLRGEVDELTVYFHRLFWTFPPCIEAFRHCKPLVSINGTRLYGKYGGTLLLAIAQDENSNILPIAFALVEGENAESWSFFLSNLRENVTTQEGILVISDRHNGIKAALEAPENGWLPPRAFRAYCKDSRRMLVNAAYAKTEAEFYYWFYIMRTENPAMCEWANRMEYDKWTQHEDSGRRLGHMTTNINECVNSGFLPPIPEGLWPPYDGPTIIPDPNMRHAKEGHPRAIRIRGSMDQSLENQPKRCGLCRQPGHTRKNCD
ncbi:uncharacterized protein LOC130965730 [Arachis stenosperma]|uniref:uncharacterized protein LOC130965730 n=1 Tax=Arachis stenosperma TaxID=217475 RepID=UPI0025AD6C1F|nr:uncharacterized protein LOC130965730 [Arachis stenosperma]